MVKPLLTLEMLHYLDKKNIIVAMLLLGSLQFFGQSRDIKKMFSEADNLYYIADYYKALKIYEQLYAIDTANNELNYKLGVCNFELKKFRKESKKYFEKVNADKFPETYYYLAFIYHTQKNYKKAITYFNDYKNAKGNLEHDIIEINALIEKCYTARYYDTSVNPNIKIENLGNSINSEFPEYAPFIPADEKFLMFTSRRANMYHTEKDAYDDYYEDVYIAKKENGAWAMPLPLDTNINSSIHDASAGLSASGEKMILFKTSADLLSGDLYESNWINNAWSNPVSMGYYINSYENIESSGCFSPDNTEVVFSSNKPGGFGGFDLYISRKLDNGTWGLPDNLGPVINTAYNEDSPFIDPSGTTLYFSSEGHVNMGGYDVFKVPFADNGKFMEPENLGAPINTVNDDIFFVINTDGTKGYISSEREGGFGSQDIYSIDFSPSQIQLKAFNVHAMDTANDVVNNVQIILTDKERSGIKTIFKSNSMTGKVLVLCNPAKKYDVAIESYGLKTINLPDYIFGTETDINFTFKKSE